MCLINGKDPAPGVNILQKNATVKTGRIKTGRLKHWMKYLPGVLILLYPLLVFGALVIFKLPLRYLSVFIIALAAACFLVNRHAYKGRRALVAFISPAILCCTGIVCLFVRSSIILKIYPVLANFAYFMIMATSVFIPPPVVLYFINLFDRAAKDRMAPELFEQYCRRATIAWCVFFAFDGCVALATVFWSSDIIWGIYNGGITYVLMGLVFAGEYFILKMMEKKYQTKRDKDGKGEETGVRT
ncbi:MAG: hypothetical protein LBF63_05635 [Treponema sp.]|jgi:uncharacterized membrane protein|nr:hypothetical protein [Treponema sp.]